MPAPSTKCRLFVLLARDAPVGLIFRRGPTKWTHLIKWNTDTDTFEPGAWFEGTMQPQYSDLSPDGTLLLYKAANYSEKNRKANFPMQWTAISKVPWVTTLSLWEHCTTYYGGGFFQTNTKIYIDDSSTLALWNHHIADPQAKKLTLPPGSKVLFQYFPNLPGMLQKRRGWKMTKDTTVENTEDKKLTYRRFVREKQQPNGHLFLMQTYLYYVSRIIGDINRTVEVRDGRNNRRTRIEGANWMDWDQRGRLVYAREGKLFTADVVPPGELTEIELADFTADKPERTRSPEWARHW